MLLVGLVGGLLAATGQASSYVVSRHFLATPGRKPFHLLVLSSVWMGLLALSAAPWLWPEVGKKNIALTVALVVSLGAYAAAQSCFFWTVRLVPASRIAPLLGIKIVMVALLAQIFAFQELNAQHWLGVVLALVAACAIQCSGKRVPLRAIVGVLLTATFFAISDIGIARCNALCTELPAWQRPLSILVANYSMAGVGGLVLAAWITRSLRRRGAQTLAWRAAIPYSAVWLVSMLALFTAISYLGVVLAIICQALRGPLSLVIGVVVARLGHHHLEAVQPWQSWLRQGLAALIMVAAIALYVSA